MNCLALIIFCLSLAESSDVYCMDTLHVIQLSHIQAPCQGSI